MEPGAPARRPAKRQRLTWTDEENELILQKVKKLGTQWDRIAAELPRRKPTNPSKSSADTC